MKSVVLCVCALVLALSNSTEIKKQLKGAIETINDDIATCMTENNMNHDDWYREEEIMTDVHAQTENEEKTRKIGCAIACILKKQGLMDGSNIKELKVHAEITKVFADRPGEGIAHRIARKCMKKVRSFTQECEKGFALYECLARAIHEAQEHDEHEKKETEEEEEEEKETTQTE